MADPQIDLVKIRNAELARRGLGAAQGISDSLSAPVRDDVIFRHCQPTCILERHVFSGTVSGYMALHLTLGAGVGASALRRS
jgi:hypothetical protein